MPNLRDLEALLGSLGGRIGSVATSPFHGDVRLGSLSPFGSSPLGGKSPFSGNLSAQNPFAGKVLGAPSPFAGRTLGAPSPFAGGTFGGMRNPFGSNPLAGFGDAANPYLPPDPNSPSARAAAASDNPGGTATYSGLDPNVSRWAAQMQSTFGDLNPDLPDIMLAIISNESGGDPNVQNRQGYPAYGLFQLWNQPGLSTDQQFAAARTLAQDKLRGLNASYQAHGLNPDARTRARDFALAWGGQFDYDNARPNPGSKDVGSGQTAEQLATVFLANYDKVKAGKQVAPAAGNSGYKGAPGWNNSITPGVQGEIMQEFGPTDYSAQHPDTYAYGNSYGLAGSQHPGVDWAVPMGSRVTTPVGGTVFVVGNDHGTGYYYKNTMSNSNPDTSGEFAIQLDNGDILILGHMSQINARVGQRLNAGDFIGLSGGSDGAHVHVEYRRKDSSTGSGYRIVDPRQYIR
jgi:murein DD-endopeptidase MepM/ murein hydrolase activator NlpD